MVGLLVVLNKWGSYRPIIRGALDGVPTRRGLYTAHFISGPIIASLSGRGLYRRGSKKSLLRALFHKSGFYRMAISDFPSRLITAFSEPAFLRKTLPIRRSTISDTFLYSTKYTKQFLNVGSSITASQLEKAILENLNLAFSP